MFVFYGIIGLTIVYADFSCLDANGRFTIFECNFAEGAGNITGKILAHQCGDEVYMSGELESDWLTDGKHGMHVHDSNDVSRCANTGGHFKSSPEEIHGASSNRLPDRHAGDLGNVEAENGRVAVAVVDRIVTLDPTQPTFIGQKAIVRVAIWDFG